MVESRTSLCFSMLKHSKKLEQQQRPPMRNCKASSVHGGQMRIHVVSQTAGNSKWIWKCTLFSSDKNMQFLINCIKWDYNSAMAASISYSLNVLVLPGFHVPAKFSANFISKWVSGLIRTGAYFFPVNAGSDSVWRNYSTFHDQLLQLKLLHGAIKADGQCFIIAFRTLNLNLPRREPKQ